MSLFGNELSEEGLQTCLHAFYESEVDTGLLLFQTFPVHKKCLKRADKIARTFLLDNLELNVKSRCVYAWSGKSVSRHIVCHHDRAVYIHDRERGPKNGDRVMLTPHLLYMCTAAAARPIPI
jgi:hypothetical protein